MANLPGTVSPGVPVNFTLSPTVSAGGYVTIQTRALSGGVNHYTSANVLVSSLGDFSLTPTTPSQTILPPGSASYPIGVNSANNFTGAGGSRPSPACLREPVRTSLLRRLHQTQPRR